MKLLIILFLSFIFYMGIASAKQTNESVSVKQLIQKVKQSSGDDRRVAMNALKVKLRSMNQETRQQVMHDLQKSFSGNQHGMQRGLQYNKMKGTMHTQNTENMHSSGSMHTSPSQMPALSSPMSAPHQSAPSIPQTPHRQPSTPQMPSPSMPVPHFGQPGGHK